MQGDLITKNQRRLQLNRRICVETTNVALDKIILDQVASCRKVVDVATIQAKADNRLVSSPGTVNPRQDSDVQVPFDAFDEIDKVGRHCQGSHFRTVR
jgi:hypothetical protein